MEEAIHKALPPAHEAATKVLPHKPSTRSKKPQPISAAQVWLLLRRLLVLAAAGLYVTTSLDGGVKALTVLYGVTDDSVQYPVTTSDLIVPFVGTSSILKSPLVDAMGGPTNRNDTVYLLSPSAVSFASCPVTATYNAWMYSNGFLRAQYADLVRDTAYNITLLKTSELVAPVVDCSTDMVRAGTTMYMRVFYLLRDKADADVVSLLAYSFAMQDYSFPDQYQSGVAGVLALSVVSDMRFQEVDAVYFALALGYPFKKPVYSVFEFVEDTDDGLRVFESVPVNASTDISRVIYTSWRRGVYNTKSETEQCNHKSANTNFGTDPVGALRDWEWTTLSQLHDAWAWVHVVHFAFAADMVFNLIVLMVVVYRNMRRGKLWIGDAFVSVSRTVAFRGLAVLLGWYLNGFWTLMEFCLHDGKVLSGTLPFFVHEAILHADLLVLYLSLAAALGFVLRERVDPALAVFLFEISFANRLAIVRLFPSAVEAIVSFMLADAATGVKPVPAKLMGISPLRFRTTHELLGRPTPFIFASMLPMLATFAVLLVYVPLRKIYRTVFPDRMVVLSRGTNLSTETEVILAWKQSLTMFEVATGAALQDRAGLVTDYDNCVYIKGMKFASADGIYCNGFVVANGKWLLRTTDLPLILGMMLASVRFADVYVFEVDAHTVQKNARLFYPEMIGLFELLQLNTMILA